MSTSAETKALLNQMLQEALGNDAWRGLRVDACDAILSALNDAGALIDKRRIGSLQGSGLFLVLAIAHELMTETLAAFAATRIYAGMALLRQLIETEYLFVLFANEPNLAEKWLLAKDKKQNEPFTPANMRKRSKGRFDADEYHRHCEAAGHPTQRGVALIVKQNGEELMYFLDAAQHFRRIFAAVGDCLMQFGFQDVTAVASFLDAKRAVEKWLRDDGAIQVLLRVQDGMRADGVAPFKT